MTTGHKQRYDSVANIRSSQNQERDVSPLHQWMKDHSERSLRETASACDNRFTCISLTTSIDREIKKASHEKEVSVMEDELPTRNAYDQIVGEEVQGEKQGSKGKITNMPSLEKLVNRRLDKAFVSLGVSPQPEDRDKR